MSPIKSRISSFMASCRVASFSIMQCKGAKQQPRNCSLCVNFQSSPFIPSTVSMESDSYSCVHSSRTTTQKQSHIAVLRSTAEHLVSTNPSVLLQCTSLNCQTLQHLWASYSAVLIESWDLGLAVNSFEIYSWNQIEVPNTHWLDVIPGKHASEK